MRTLLSLTFIFLIPGLVTAQTVLLARLPVVGPTPTVAQARQLALNGPRGYHIKTCKAELDAGGKFAHSELTPMPYARPEDRKIGVQLSGRLQIIDQKRRLELRYVDAWPVQFIFDKKGVALPTVTEFSLAGGVILNNEGCAVIDNAGHEKLRDIVFVTLLPPEIVRNEPGKAAPSAADKPTH